MKNKYDKRPKLTIFDICFKEPLKRFAGVQNQDGGVGKIAKYSKEIEREISNTDVQKNAYIQEQTKIISEAIRKGDNTYFDFQYALEKVDFKIIDEYGKEIKINGYNYPTYIENLIKFNQSNKNKLDKVSKNDYQGLTRLQDVIDQLKMEYENMTFEKSRIDRTVDKYNKRNK